MLPVFTPYTEPKKEYKFIWYIGRDDITKNLNSADLSGIGFEVRVKFNTLMNHLFTSYISQLAEKVNPPDDKIDTEDYNIGMVKIPVPKSIEMPDIVVTYLDDSNDTVYNFHKSWQSFIRHGDSLSLESLYPYSINARYITYENTLTSAEHTAMKKVLDFNDWIRQYTGDVETSNLSLTTGNVDVFMKPHSIYNFPNIFPVSISRDEGDKGGTGLAKVTVTYKRLPKIRKRSSYKNLAGKQFFITDSPMTPNANQLQKAIEYQQRYSR